ncbi:hypothetical protein CCZ20_21205 [Priestia aryabhattai]|uniref:Hsp70 family protein n=1 Tax=Priestia aryabhattai TaxID=412384 RepID=UPI000B50C068|nr:Hsp70 family protein [Priestia aryabhattai]OVE35347.1 hypothetical protein CCZ20_21205 [Priestia aryabhattai]
MGLSVGIDLGTSNSTAAVYRRGKVESIPIEGKKVLPSVVSYKDNGQILVGHSAKARLYIDPQNTVSSSKRFIGDSNKQYHIHNKALTPVDIAQEILKKIKTEASKYLGEEVKDAVITIPAYFTDEQREATKKAGELAGFNVLRLLSEPTAAAIAYGLDKERNQTIMVYDLGGGTFDVSILKVEGNSFEVEAVDGDSLLGGDDFDEKIMNYLLSNVSNGASANQMSPGSLSMQRLKEAAEEAKKELSESDFTDISIPDIFGTHIDEEVDVETFNKMIQPLLERTINKINEVLEEADLTKRDISRVILVGGSTRMRAVQEAVTQNIKKPYIADNVDEIVAQGAAIMAANLSAPSIDTAPVPIEVKDVTAHSLGIGFLSENDEYRVVHLIKRNTVLPCTGAEMGFTRYPNQKNVRMAVYRTNDTIPLDEHLLGELVLSVTPKEEPVSVVALFELDNSGVLTFSSAELSPDSALFREYSQTEVINLRALKEMIENKELKIKQATIDTNKQEA